MTAPGRPHWYIPDAYLPLSGQGERWESHESICVLNLGDVDAAMKMTLYFEDREPIRIDPVVVKACSNRHIGMHQPERLGGVMVPRDTPYGIAIESDQPIIVQYSRLDVTQPNFSLMTTIPYSEDNH
jgi:hypothetical protein